jgi:hypothetical protein
MGLNNNYNKMIKNIFYKYSLLGLLIIPFLYLFFLNSSVYNKLFNYLYFNYFLQESRRKVDIEYQVPDFKANPRFCPKIRFFLAYTKYNKKT